MISACFETHRKGLLDTRVRLGLQGLRCCRLCPRRCGADRLQDRSGACRTGRRAKVSSYGPHGGEERALSGSRGSGTVFFSACNLGCAFCQNREISQSDQGVPAGKVELAAMALELQRAGCHNLNLVTPSHVVPQILEALALAVEHGFRLPVVYNTSAYDSVATLRLLEGVVDIYMPDFKFWDAGLCERHLGTRDYAERAREAVLEMHRQVGVLQLDPETGLARRGVLLRHLVMPGCLDDSMRVFRWAAQALSPDTCVNVMGQYRPLGRDTTGFPHPLGREEHLQALRLAREAGLRRLCR